MLYQTPTTASATSAHTQGHSIPTANDDDDAAERLEVVNTRSKPMLLELKQFVSLTCGTSAGSASVTSAH